MSDPYWLRIAKSIKEGTTTRIQCCKSDTSMIIGNDVKGYSAYCFRCGFKGYRRHGERSISSIVQNTHEIEFKRSVSLPEDYVSIIHGSDAAKLWILKYGIPLDVAMEYKIGYSKKMDRVILPVYDKNDKLFLCQARALNGRKPKYINNSVFAANVIFWGKECINNFCVVTEDILSAIKVSMEVPACSILGTNMTAEKAMLIAAKYSTVYMWMDNDSAGQRCSLQAEKQLLMQGVYCVKHIRTDRDPKTYTSYEINYEVDK